MKTKIFSKVFIGFFNGMAILLPVIITVWIIRFLVFKVNDIVLTPFLKLFHRIGDGIQHVYIAKALILVMVLFLIACIGWAARILFIKRIFSWGESIFIKVPIMGKIYNAIKQISSAFIGHGKTMFKHVVLVEYPRKGLYSIGFTTGETKGKLNDVTGGDSVNVFIATTPNPTSGMFVVVPRGDIRFLEMSVEDGMKLVVSGGSVSPECVVRGERQSA
ncbi:MAG: DUF502 domain-containing protein [Candidatus Omnitrophica bacterium]|nr:DUF502 domain-containing protein [Candidatus Omnitrophota bacterium]MBU1128172.1 DUF502 domain-containing protein [Candidatus Omnitrophota bacterium]MBU1785204.1 DUF502 domain-containing protein [Candidatus Omnitrophota bacterium]MBU1852075.1 DUF502 domain-containing protein [Candidatus Omnitrophota bacterium]